MRKFLTALLPALALMAGDVTVYNSQALISQSVKPKGSKVFLPQCVVPDSIYTEAKSYRFLKKSSIEDALRPLIGREIRFLKNKKVIKGRLIGLSPLIIQADRIYWDVALKDIVIKSLPKDFAPMPTLILPGIKETTLRYICKGVRWKSVYHMDLDKKLHIKGLIQITSPHHFKNVRVKVVAGDDSAITPVYLKSRAVSAVAGAPKPVGGRYVYEISGRWDLNGESFLPYIDESIPFKQVFKVRFSNGFAAKIEKKAGRYIVFKSPKPLPKGRAFIYKDGLLLHTSYLWDIPKGKEVELFVGGDFDIRVVKEVVSLEKSKRFIRSKVRYSIYNPKPKAVHIDIEERIPTTALKIKGECPYRILNASSLLIKAQVAPKASLECDFEYYLPKR